MTRLRRWPAAVTLVLVVAATGCEVDVGSGRDRPEAIEQIQSSGQLRWDLRDGLTREEVGLPEGWRSQQFGPAGDDPIDAEVVVDEDTTITYDVRLVQVEGTDADGRVGTPSHLVLSNTFPSIDGALEELDDAVRTVGIDPDEVRSWAASVRRSAAEQDAPAFFPHVFSAPARGDVGIEVEASVTQPDGRVTVTYLLRLR